MSGDLKSGIPAEVEMPAPVMTTIRLGRPSLMYSATPDRERDKRVRGGVLGSIWEFSWPIFRGLLRWEWLEAFPLEW